MNARFSLRAHVWNLYNSRNYCANTTWINHTATTTTFGRRFQSCHFLSCFPLALVVTRPVVLCAKIDTRRVVEALPRTARCCCLTKIADKSSRLVLSRRCPLVVFRSVLFYTDKSWAPWNGTTGGNSEVRSIEDVSRIDNIIDKDLRNAFVVHDTFTMSSKHRMG